VITNTVVNRVSALPTVKFESFLIKFKKLRVMKSLVTASSIHL